jgi:hypothetical protein
VTNGESTTSQYGIEHIRPLTEFAGDLQANTVASYNFITPNLCDDMHSCGIIAGDIWLAINLPPILDSSAYKLRWSHFHYLDEAATGDGPIGMIVLSPLAKRGYENSIYYNHGSTLRTIEEIFHITPIFGDAANQKDLSDLFTSFP